MTAEIISTVERWRQWSTKEKVRTMSEALEPGVTIASVADRDNVCRSLLYTWLPMRRAVSLAADGEMGFTTHQPLITAVRDRHA